MHCSSRVPDVQIEVARLGAEREVVWRATVRSRRPRRFPTKRGASGCDWPVAVSIATDAGVASGHVRDPAANRRGGARSVAGVRGRAPPRARTSVDTCWCSAPTRGRRTTSGVGGACTAEPPRSRSGGRSSAGYVTRAVDADGYDGRVSTRRRRRPRCIERLQGYLAAHEYPLWTASSGWFNWERRFAEWAEREGIELDYAVDADLDSDSDVLDGRRAAAHRRSQRVLVVGDARSRSTASSRPAATGRSSPGTPASGRCATRPTTTR